MIEIKTILSEILPQIDDHTLEYFYTLITENGSLSDENIIQETLVPFIESYGLVNSENEAIEICKNLIKRIKSSGIDSSNKVNKIDDIQLLDKVVSMSVSANTTFSKTEKATLDVLWGFDQIRNKRNDAIQTSEAGSARYERKAVKDQKRWLNDLEKEFHNSDHENDDIQISSMMLPDFSGKNNEKDIQVNNITISFAGKLLLEGADIRIVYGRRYGLIGKNGVGKTTLLRHMANFDIEGFPRHHRILHVKQEVKSSSKSVVEVVLEADVERTQLLTRQKALIEKQQNIDDVDEIQNILEQLNEVSERMNLIGVHTAEMRVAIILSGLKFTEEMQMSSTSSLSGGWLMRVSLATALFIEPDVLMLDEPTNHLDLEAVLWLQNYLIQYPHTILLVSHDRAFLNEVCTDIILFKDLKLTYYRGNFDTFEKTRAELQLLQHRQHEAQVAKLAHMQEFVDKFRFNAKRASLVQSRIKAINKEKEELIEDVVDETSFQFTFPDAGSIGHNAIKLQQVSFGYMKNNQTKLLFSNVDLSIEQSSRIALVGPNGAGKSTLLNLIQLKLQPTEGFISVNPQLRLATFTQHHLDSFDLNLSPVQNMMNRWPQAHEADLRSHLGRYEISGNDALKPMKFSSGGQKSRVAFACLTYTKPHIVLLDEPTNHLDMGAIEALIKALQAFNDGILVISHDQYFIQSVCKEIWVVGDGTVKQFNGTFEDYKKMTLELSKKSSNNKIKL